MYTYQTAENLQMHKSLLFFLWFYRKHNVVLKACSCVVLMKPKNRKIEQYFLDGFYCKIERKNLLLGLKTYCYTPILQG